MALRLKAAVLFLKRISISKYSIPRTAPCVPFHVHVTQVKASFFPWRVWDRGCVPLSCVIVLSAEGFSLLWLTARLRLPPHRLTASGGMLKMQPGSRRAAGKTALPAGRSPFPLGLTQPVLRVQGDRGCVWGQHMAGSSRTLT